ncbi:AfsR/SARP family transcriptional regulator [Amycolatopsis aidingensis]|uniref:AfsR/SARP family transcriptional regulator n=1 Tax=Amycolatopsis aidingensis TaxID=2842453 RepID=UPI001C0E7517|nr:AfsR/SARP family transcriptional regulator [Amycolatopsis aidingensis]
MQIKVLGPLAATMNGRPALPTAAKPRRIFALLALRPGQVVPVATLIEELWGDCPPRSARATLHTYIMQLRRKLGADANELLVTQFNGYLLNIDPEQVDVHEYDRLATTGRRAAEAGDHRSAARLLKAALELWRGPALVDIPTGEMLAVEVTRLEESRLNVVENRIETEMHLGRHHTLLSELAMLTARNPMNENLCALYMISLFRCGRQWQALDAFTSLRNTLTGELGVEPSTRLRDLQRAILTADAELDRVESRELQQMLG